MIIAHKKQYASVFKARLAPWITSAIVLLAGLIVTTVLWRDAQQHQTADLSAKFETAADYAANNILRRLNTYETIMRGVKGYIDGSDDVRPDEFRTYVKALKLQDGKLGVLGIGIVKLVPNADKAKHIAEIRKQGIPNYDIKPVGQRDVYAPIVRIEPMTAENLKALGLDTLTVPVALSAMQRARDLNEVAITSHFTLAQDAGKPNASSFVMYFPLYKHGVNLDTLSARRSAIEGWVDVPFRLNDIMVSLKGQFAQDIDLEIYDGKVMSDQSLMYQSDAQASKSRLVTETLQTQRKLEFAGKTWILLAKTTPAFVNRVSNSDQPKIIIWSGSLLSFVLAILAWVLMRDRVVARNNYQKLFSQAGEGVLMLNHEHRLLDANPSAVKMFGYSREELLNLNLPKLLADSEVEKINPTVASLMAGEPHNGEWMHVRKDGSQFLVEVNARKLDNNSYFATLRDLTNRKKNEQRIVRLNNLYQALSEINQAIVRMSDERELFPLVCKSAVKFGGMQMAWVGELDQSCNLILPKASYGKGLDYLENLKVSVNPDIPEGCGPTGTAFRESHFVIINDFIENPSTQPWHTQAKQFGWQSAGAFPIPRNGKPFAVFSVYSPEVDAFEKEAVDLLKEMSSDITFALDNFDREAQRRLAQDKLKLAQIKVTESLDRYTDLYEFAPIGYLSICKDGMLNEVNWKVTSMFGLKRNELNKHAMVEFVIEKEQARWQSLFLSMQDLEAGEELNFDMSFAHHDDSVFMANLNCLRMDDEDNKPILRVAMLDVTQLKHTEEAKQRSEISLQATLDAIPDLLFETDINGQYYFVHSPDQSLFAAPAEVLIGKTVNEVLPTDAAYVAMSAIREADDEGKSHGKQFELDLPQGKRWFELSVSKKPTLAGEGKRFIVLSRNITERKQADLEYRIAATAFESQEGMIVTDANKIILKVNKAFTKISGFLEEEAIGQTPRLVSSGDHHEDFYASMWQSIDENGGWEGEVWNRRKSGEVYPQHLTITAVKSAGGVVTNYVATFTDVTLRNAAEAEINHLAFYDVLTRLPNRRLLIDRLNHALAAGKRLGWGGALLFLDLDHFKTLNDTLGHDVGDMLLRQVAERLTTCVREGDTVARLGGDEFVVMLEDLSKLPIEAASQAEIIANKILTTINQPYQLATNTYQTTASIGVVLFSDYEHTQDALLKHADIAMYQAKKMGRNRLCFFDPKMQEAINTRASLEVDLHKALDNKQFALHYQIQVDRLGRATGAEALIRWIHPERGMISPLEFIPLAEETGMILPIGEWVLETACAQLSAWQAEPLSQNLTLSINVSAKQFFQAEFASQVKSAVKQYAVNAMQLKLELTESILLEKIDGTIVKMKELKDIGVSFSLDDFGTGYSSLQYLKLLPLDQLKIDRSFVRDIAIESSDQAIVRTVIAMAQTLNLDVIAEGVETKVQQEILANCECNSYQGFLFGKAMPIEQFNLALKSNLALKAS